MRTSILTGLCAVLFLIASVEAVLLIRNHREQKRLTVHGPFHAHDPFQMMRQIYTTSPLDSPTDHDYRDKLFSDFYGHPLFKDFGREFDESPSLQEPKWEEHGSELHMVLDIKGHSKGDYSVNISDEQITLTGKERLTQDDAGLTQESHWSNSQSFPLPPEADPKDFKVERTQDKLIVIFKKRDLAISSMSDNCTEPRKQGFQPNQICGSVFIRHKYCHTQLQSHENVAGVS